MFERVCPRCLPMLEFSALSSNSKDYSSSLRFPMMVFGESTDAMPRPNPFPSRNDVVDVGERVSENPGQRPNNDESNECQRPIATLSCSHRVGVVSSADAGPSRATAHERSFSSLGTGNEAAQE